MDDDSEPECPVCAEARTTYARAPKFHVHKKRQR